MFITFLHFIIFTFLHFKFFHSHRCTTATCQMQMQGVALGYFYLANSHLIRVTLVVGMRPVLIDDGTINGIVVKKIKVDFQIACLLIGNASDKPTIAMTLFSGDGYIFTNFTVWYQRATPGGRTTLYESKCRLAFVVLNGIGSHL